MTAAWLALHYLRARPLLNVLTALAVAAGVALVIATNALSTSARHSAREIAGGYQLLVAAKGSPVQAVLSTLFFIEAPTGNIPIGLYDELREDQRLAVAVPFNFGDSYRGHFIVGTTVDYLKLVEVSTGRPVRQKNGGRWPMAPFEVAVGALAADATGLTLGDQFVAAHGFIELPVELAQQHSDRAYTVVGILEPLSAPSDRAIFTPLETAWLVHTKPHPFASQGELGEQSVARDGKPKEITALLIHGKSYGDVARLSATLSQRQDVQAIFPGRVATQVLNYMQRGEVVLKAMAWLAAGIAAFAITVSLLAASIERRRQIATLRAIGATRRTVFGVLAIEAAMIAGVGALVGIALGAAIARIVAWQLALQSGLVLDLAPIGISDLSIASAAVVLGVAAGRREDAHAVSDCHYCSTTLPPHRTSARSGPHRRADRRGSCRRSEADPRLRQAIRERSCSVGGWLRGQASCCHLPKGRAAQSGGRCVAAARRARGRDLRGRVRGLVRGKAAAAAHR